MHRDTDRKDGEREMADDMHQQETRERCCDYMVRVYQDTPCRPIAPFNSLLYREMNL